MTELRQVEYQALRATIRERGTWRIAVFWLTIAGWAVLASGVAAVHEVPAFALLPLVLLLGGFEAVASLHMGIERIGRYLQVFYEEEPGQNDGPRWETTAMAYGRLSPARAPDALFSGMFAAAVILNMLPVVPLATPPEIAGLAVVHLGVLARIFLARRAAGRQRVEDLERFRRLKNESRPQGLAEMPCCQP